MWMLIRNVLLAGMVVLWATPALSEYYQYKDQNGVLRFTDDLSSVPPDQRPDIKTHQSIESQPVQKTTGTVEKETANKVKASPATGTPPSGGTWQKRNAQKKQELDQMQAELKITFESLQAERAKLETQAPPKDASFKEKVAYTEKVQALNLKIANYESQLDAFNEKVSAYNQQAQK